MPNKVEQLWTPLLLSFFSKGKFCPRDNKFPNNQWNSIKVAESGIPTAGSLDITLYYPQRQISRRVYILGIWHPAPNALHPNLQKVALLKESDKFLNKCGNANTENRLLLPL